MTEMTFLSAVRNTIKEQMVRDRRVFMMGQDLEALTFDAPTRALLGAERVRNTPISEAGFIGAAVGAALTGMRPIVELGCSTFLYSAMDQIVNQAAKNRYMFGGQASVPMVIRAPLLYGRSVAAHHSDRPWALFAQSPGLKIIVPTTAHDAKGLLISALQDENPVLCFEDSLLWNEKGEVPDFDYAIPLGKAEVKRPGTDVTVVALAAAVHHSLAAAAELAVEEISVEVIDLRSIVPLDSPTILQSVSKTGRLVIVDPAPGTCSVASEVAAIVAEDGFRFLKGPISRLTAPNVPVPFSPYLEPLVYPTSTTIAQAIRRVYQKSHKPHVEYAHH